MLFVKMTTYLEHLSGRTDEFVCFGVQRLLSLAQRLKFTENLRFLYSRSENSKNK